MKSLYYILCSIAFLMPIWVRVPVAEAAGGSVPASISVLLKQHQWEAALKALQQVEPASEFHEWAVGEASKIYYREQQWPRLFGLASYARNHLSASDTRDQVRLLEILALLRHCQKEMAIEQVRGGLRETLPQARVRFEMLAQLLEVAPLAPDETPLSEKAPAVSEPGIFKNRNLWPIPVKAAQKLDPWKLERKIEALCDKSEGT